MNDDYELIIDDHESLIHGTGSGIEGGGEGISRQEGIDGHDPVMSGEWV